MPTQGNDAEGMSTLNHSRSFDFFIINFFSPKPCNLEVPKLVRTFIIIFQWIIAYKLVQKPKIEALNEPKAMAAFGPEQSQNVRSG